MHRRGPVLVLFALALAAAGAESYRLTVYYDGPPGIAREIERAFEAYRGDVLSLLPMPVDGVGDADAGLATADIVWGGDEPLLRRLRASHRLRPYNSTELPALVPGAADESGAVSGLECMVIAYDPARLSTPVPMRWRDLLDSRWNGKVVLLNPGSSPEALAAASAIVRLLDWSYLEALVAQRAQVVASNEEALARLVSGDALVALVPYDAVAGARSSLAVAWPVDGRIATPRPVAILEQPKRPAMMTGLAEQLVDYILSAEGQTIGRRHGLYPTRRDVGPPAGAPSLAQDSESARAEPPSSDFRERVRRLFGSR